MRVTTLQEKYLNEVFGLNDPELDRVRERMQDKERISISGAEARVLQFLIRGFGIRKIVEFGTLYGYSALAMAKVLPPEGKIYTLEKDPEYHAQAARTFAESPSRSKIESLCGEASVLMATLAARGPFDMVFIDANKAGYVDYLNWAEKNVRAGGLIVGDNTFLWGALWEKSSRPQADEATVSVMREFNARLSDPRKYNSTLLPTVEGLTVAQKL